MEAILPDPPFIAVPSRTPERELAAISGCFRGSSEIQTIYGHQLPVARFDSATATSAIEFTAWLIQFGPDLLRQIALWALGTYAGKKFIDGFLTEAGKDLWKGVKALGTLVQERFRRTGPTPDENPSILNLSGVGRSSSTDPYYDVLITLHIPADPPALQSIYGYIERLFFPLIGCLSLNAPEVRLRIYAEDSAFWPWRVWNLHTNTMYGVHMEQRTFADLSIHDMGDEETPACFRGMGFHECEVTGRPKKRL